MNTTTTTATTTATTILVKILAEHVACLSLKKQRYTAHYYHVMKYQLSASHALSHLDTSRQSHAHTPSRSQSASDSRFAHAQTWYLALHSRDKCPFEFEFMTKKKHEIPRRDLIRNRVS